MVVFGFFFLSVEKMQSSQRLNSCRLKTGGSSPAKLTLFLILVWYCVQVWVCKGSFWIYGSRWCNPALQDKDLGRECEFLTLLDKKRQH